jgi:hypothetical protein
MAALMVLMSSAAGAFDTTQIGYPAGGNPGDACVDAGEGGTATGTACQPYYEVSGLVAGDSFQMSWFIEGDEFLGPDLIPDLPTIAAHATITVNAITTTSVLIGVTIYNTTQDYWNPVGFEGGVVSFGMELVGFASGLLSATGASLDTYALGNIAGGAGLSSDFCASTDPACNSGNPMDAIGNNESDSFQFTLAGAFDDGPGGITLSNFATKWQTNYDTLVIPDDPNIIAGNSSFEQPGHPGQVPEPSTAMLMLFGVGMVVAAGRRKH